MGVLFGGRLFKKTVPFFAAYCENCGSMMGEIQYFQQYTKERPFGFKRKEFWINSSALKFEQKQMSEKPPNMQWFY